MKGKYSSQSFDTRYEYLGDTAENAFETWADRNHIAYVRYGMSRPPFTSFQYLPRAVRHTPDYICEFQSTSAIKVKPFFKHVFVEVKGVGRDQLIKFKKLELKTLLAWQEFSGRPVFYFVYDKTNERTSFDLHATHLDNIKDDLEEDAFEQGKEYYKLPTDELSWEKYYEGS